MDLNFAGDLEKPVASPLRVLHQDPDSRIFRMTVASGLGLAKGRIDCSKISKLFSQSVKLFDDCELFSFVSSHS